MIHSFVYKENKGRFTILLIQFFVIQYKIKNCIQYRIQKKRFKHYCYNTNADIACPSMNIFNSYFYALSFSLITIYNINIQLSLPVLILKGQVPHQHIAAKIPGDNPYSSGGNCWNSTHRFLPPPPFKTNLKSFTNLAVRKIQIQRWQDRVGCVQNFHISNWCKIFG